MPRFHKQEFYNKKENRFKVFSYTIALPRRIVEEAKLENVEVEVKVENGKIIINKSVDK